MITNLISVGVLERKQLSMKTDKILYRGKTGIGNRAASACGNSRHYQFNNLHKQYKRKRATGSTRAK